MSICDNGISTCYLELIFTECKFSHVCIIYAEIFEKMSSSGLEVRCKSGFTLVRGVQPIIVCSNDDPGLALTHQIW